VVSEGEACTKKKKRPGGRYKEGVKTGSAIRKKCALGNGGKFKALIRGHRVKEQEKKWDQAYDSVLKKFSKIWGESKHIGTLKGGDEGSKERLNEKIKGKKELKSNKRL